MSATTVELDVFVQYEGTIGIIYGKTEAGADWLAENLDPNATRWGGGYVVEHRYIGPILEGALEAGFRIGGS